MYKARWVSALLVPFMSSSQKDAVERGYEADQRAVVWAFFTTLVTLVMIGVNLGFMYSHMGQRVMLTSIEVFHDWGGLRQIFQDTVSLDPRFNLPSLDYYTHFDTSSASLMVIKDLHSRGLMSDGDFKNASALFNQSTGLPLTGALDPRLLSQLASEFFGKFSGNLTALVLQGLPTSVVVSAPGLTDPRLLSRLLSVSGCSFPDALPGATPTTRSAGCRCIAESYLGFVKASANMTTNITAAVRERGGAEALKCLDRRVTWHTWGAGDMWTIHPVGLAFYSSSILFLTCVGFLIPFYHQHLFPESWDVRFRTLAIKLTLAGLTGVLVLLFALHDFLANLFQILGLVLVLSNFLFSLSSVLDYPGKGAVFREPFKPEPHPLVVSFWVNFPMLLPAPLVAVAISGYIRDVYAVGAIAVIGAVVGIIMQVFMWLHVLCMLVCCDLPVFSVLSRGSSGMCGMMTTSSCRWCSRLCSLPCLTSLSCWASSSWPTAATSQCIPCPVQGQFLRSWHLLWQWE